MSVILMVITIIALLLVLALPGSAALWVAFVVLALDILLMLGMLAVAWRRRWWGRS